MASDKERIAELEAQLKAVTEQQRQFSASVGEAVSKALAEALPLATMAAAQVVDQQRSKRVEVERFQRCSICGQATKGCQGRHVKMYVGPSNPRRLNSFTGITINGVNYRSTYPGELITVPAENSIHEFLNAWEASEDDLRNGRVVNHFSGELSGKDGSKSGTAANPFGFRQMMPAVAN